MPRPYGTPNLQVPDPPFIAVLGKAKAILTPHRIEVVDNDGIKGFGWEFDVTFEHTTATKMTLDDVKDLEIMFKLIARWATKMDHDQEKLEGQLEELKKKLSFLQR
jgi:hypothetical protein